LVLFKKGDRYAFNCIYEKYWEGLFLCALKKLGEKEEAEDLIQDLFVSIWMKREDFEINSSLKAYLFIALKYKIINHFEFKRVRRKHMATLKEAFDELDNGTSNKILAAEVERRLEGGVNKLSPKVKLVYQLSREQNLSLDEIAEKLAVSKQTVKNQISKALKALKAHLNHGYFWIGFFTSVYLIFS
jgi:RNA polymerase sigma-70 factor (ECF subfamily)